MYRLTVLLVCLCCLVATSGHAYPPTMPPANPPCLRISTPEVINPVWNDPSVTVRISNNTGPTYVRIVGNSIYGGFVNRWFRLDYMHEIPFTNPPVYRFTFEELEGLTYYTVYAYDQYYGVSVGPFFVGL